MKRVIALSLVMLFSVGVMLPLTTDWSEASKTKVTKKRKKFKKYSRAWWRQYRAKQRRARALAARRRALAERRKELAQKAAETAGSEKAVAATTAESSRTPQKRRGAEKPTPQRATPVLGGEVSVAAGGSDLQFRVADTTGRQIGSAELRVVGAAMPANEEGMPDRARKQMLAGVPVSALRRTVIDKMISENGWIVNDYQREVNGRKVFVVVAQTSAGGGAVQSRQFYFTEVDGRIYSLSTNAPNDYSEKVAADSERALTTILQRNPNRPAQSAELR